MTDAAEKPKTEQKSLFVFEELTAEKQFVKLAGASALEISEALEDGDQVIMEIRGVVQDLHFKTRSRGRKDTSAKIRTVTVAVKVDTATVKRTVPKLVKS